MMVHIEHIHRPPKVFGQGCLPVAILHVQCFGIHISSLYFADYLDIRQYLTTNY